jgi:hypothetical protein
LPNFTFTDHSEPGGYAETAAVLMVTVAGYRFSGKLARRRIGRARPAEA